MKISINHKFALRNTVSLLRFQNDVLSSGPALYIFFLATVGITPKEAGKHVLGHSFFQDTSFGS